ncbi:hypothetical protein [Streptomyces sp. NPDC059168]|uniref:hypothetical protein n=1 Tax=Streptomyces sp. NPDC059168 TaxID=3346753 RepID=UPI0036901E47
MLIILVPLVVWGAGLGERIGVPLGVRHLELRVYQFSGWLISPCHLQCVQVTLVGFLVRAGVVAGCRHGYMTARPISALLADPEPGRRARIRARLDQLGEGPAVIFHGLCLLLDEDLGLEARPMRGCERRLAGLLDDRRPLGALRLSVLSRPRAPTGSGWVWSGRR